MDKAEAPSLGQRLMQAGYPKSHAYQIASAATNGTISLRVALRTYKRAKIKLGPIANADGKKIEELMRFSGEAA